MNIVWFLAGLIFGPPASLLFGPQLGRIVGSTGIFPSFLLILLASAGGAYAIYASDWPSAKKDSWIAALLGMNVGNGFVVALLLYLRYF